MAYQVSKLHLLNQPLPPLASTKEWTHITPHQDNSLRNLDPTHPRSTPLPAYGGSLLFIASILQPTVLQPMHSLPVKPTCPRPATFPSHSIALPVSA